MASPPGSPLRRLAAAAPNCLPALPISFWECQGRRAKKLEGPRPPTASSLGAEWSRALCLRGFAATAMKRPLGIGCRCPPPHHLLVDGEAPQLCAPPRARGGGGGGLPALNSVRASGARTKARNTLPVGHPGCRGGTVDWCARTPDRGPQTPGRPVLSEDPRGYSMSVLYSTIASVS